jgi:2-polyprenyl-3-methyl-5-hydroxy-6-metoxy-1,4-benzoquinol methylase
MSKLQLDSYLEKPKSFFHFGENWSQYLDKYFNDELLNEALEITKNFCRQENIKDKTFIDIGCGSGLFSLVAHKLGAKRILSIDIDENSIACCRRLKSSVGDPDSWSIVHASILDDAFIESLGKFDFVYSWGVLHHTGQMWKAIENATKLVADQGHFCLAIYNKSEGLNIYPDFRFGNSKFWLLEKKIYTSLPRFIQSLVNFLVMAILIFLYIITFNNPIKKIKNHKSFRGMNWKTDIIDWLGGYPYEFASVEEIFQFIKALGFSLENLKANNGLLNNEFLFKYWGRS